MINQDLRYTSFKDKTERDLYDIHRAIPWTHLITLRCRGITAIDGPGGAYVVTNLMLRAIRKSLGSVTAGFAVLNALLTGREHIHIVVRANDPTALDKLTSESLAQILNDHEFPLAKHPGDVDVQSVYDIDGAVSYIFKNLSRRSGRGGLFYPGMKRLKRFYTQFPVKKEVPGEVYAVGRRQHGDLCMASD